MPISSFAPAKLNLTLHVTGRRPDGYHELDSLVVFLDVGDRVTVAPAASLRFSLAGPTAPALEAEDDNLVLRAARILATAGRVGAGADLMLEKVLPVAAGLGGGSSDAAAALRALSRLWNCGLSDEDLAALALRLGADVPACVLARPSRMRGIGERLDRLAPLPEFHVLLVNPGFPLPTRNVFAAREGSFSPPADWPSRFEGFEHLVTVLSAAQNDLEAPACRIDRRIADLLGILCRLPGARLARMSGSGATCFALFQLRAEAESAAVALRTASPAWWVCVASPTDATAVIPKECPGKPASAG